MTNKKSYKEADYIQKRGKIRYRERLAEEEEAEKDIKNYKKEDDEDDGADEIQNIIW